MTATQKAYKQQIHRVTSTIASLRKQGVPISQLETEFLEALSARPTKASVEKLKREYSKSKIYHKAGLVRVGNKYITRQQYEEQREQRYERQRIQYAEQQATKRIHQQAKEAKKRGLALYYDQRMKSKDYELPEIVTSRSPQPSQPPKLSDKIFERVHQMISDTRSNGSAMLEKELSRQIKKYGRTAVEKSFEALPSHYIEQMETLIKYGDDSKQNSLTIKHIAEAIKSEILSDAERMEIANTTDSEEDYGE